MTRTAAGWWLVTPAGLMQLDLPAPTTASLLTDRPRWPRPSKPRATTQHAVPVDSQNLLSPISTPARIVAQMVNYHSHAIDSGMDSNTVPPAFFRKASHSVTGPKSNIIRPYGVEFLDYEVELGLVIGADMPVGTCLTDDNLVGYVAALVVGNDISARQIQLTKTQFYEAKSYPTFTPLGPWLSLVDAADLSDLQSLRLRLSVNGEVRQDSTSSDMLV